MQRVSVKVKGWGLLLAVPLACAAAVLMLTADWLVTWMEDGDE